MSDSETTETLDVCNLCFDVYPTSTLHMCTISNQKLLPQKAEVVSDECSSNITTSIWTDANTRFMLNCYCKYLEQIGPMKTFKNKKAMWTKIVQDMKVEIGSSFTEIQIENRYKTVMKRNKAVNNVNNTSGSAPISSSVSEEFAKIAALDDSIEPSVQVGSSSSGLKRILKEDAITKHAEPQIKKKDKTSLSDILFTIHKEKEKSRLLREMERQKRHEEKMDILKTILNNKQN